MVTQKGCVAFVVASVLIIAGSRHAHAFSGTKRVAYPGSKVAAKATWPKGVAEFVNLPNRTTGWWSYFSELQNDVKNYRFLVKDTEELNALVAKFAAIESDKLEVVLSPESARSRRATGGLVSDGPPEPVLFSIGDQETIDRWFSHLKRDENGRRVLGGLRYDRPPVARPPTLTIFVQDPAVDLDRLQIPANVRVTTAVRETEASAIEAIKGFQSRRADN